MRAFCISTGRSAYKALPVAIRNLPQGTRWDLRFRPRRADSNPADLTDDGCRVHRQWVAEPTTNPAPKEK